MAAAVPGKAVSASPLPNQPMWQFFFFPLCLQLTPCWYKDILSGISSLSIEVGVKLPSCWSSILSFGLAHVLSDHIGGSGGKFMYRHLSSTAPFVAFPHFGGKVAGTGFLFFLPGWDTSVYHISPLLRWKTLYLFPGVTIVNCKEGECELLLREQNKNYFLPFFIFSFLPVTSFIIKMPSGYIPQVHMHVTISVVKILKPSIIVDK